MFSSLRSTVRRRSTVAAAGTVVLLAVGGGTAAYAASGDSTPTPSSSSSTCTTSLRAVLRGGMRAQLREDLKALRAQPKDRRAADRADIRRKALAGEYGARVERLAAIVAGRGSATHAWAASLPSALKTDLKALRTLQPKTDERKAKAQAIVAKALSGGYGATLQQRAERAQRLAQKRCAAKQG